MISEERYKQLELVGGETYELEAVAGALNWFTCGWHT
jgi:hypothetical protein